MPKTLRIIAGRWRNRTIGVIDAPGLRPTLSRLRETLFNWLQADIVGARCLDLYAGSGVLGIEALSRGAAFVDFVDNHPKVVEHLKGTLSELGADDGYQVWRQPALSFCQSDRHTPYDIIFLDPPFAADELLLILDRLRQNACMKAETLVYVEAPIKAKDLLDSLEENWDWHRQKRTAQVIYGLFTLGV